MPLDPSLNDHLLGQARADGPAVDWYTLANGDIGTKELPRYARSMRVSLESSVTLPFLMVVVPVGNADDAATRTIKITTAGEHYILQGVRRIHSVAGGSTVPSGAQIDLITR